MEIRTQSYSLQAEFERMVQFAQNRLGSLAIHHAWLEYSSWIDKKYPINSSEDSLFIPWFLFIWRPNGNLETLKDIVVVDQSIAESFAQENSVSEGVRSLIQMSQSASLSFYLVDSQHRLSDLLLDKKYDVVHFGDFKYISTGDIIFGLVFSGSVQNYLVGCSKPISPLSLGPIIKLRNWMQTHKKDLKEAIKGVSSELFEIYRDFSN